MHRRVTLVKKVLQLMRRIPQYCEWSLELSQPFVTSWQINNHDHEKNDQRSKTKIKRKAVRKSGNIGLTECAVRINMCMINLRVCLLQLQDFDLPPSVLGRFCSDPDFVLDPASIGGAIWCHVLPRYHSSTCWMHHTQQQKVFTSQKKGW